MGCICERAIVFVSSKLISVLLRVVSHDEMDTDVSKTATSASI